MSRDYVGEEAQIHPCEERSGFLKRELEVHIV